ncbi:MAG: hypothetical protein AB7O62_16330 [Pirellulales bacterium]
MAATLPAPVGVLLGAAVVDGLVGQAGGGPAASALSAGFSFLWNGQKDILGEVPVAWQPVKAAKAAINKVV